MQYVVAPTTHGPVRGRRHGGVCVFKGIRYGASTGGENRFRAPRPPSPWREPADALEFGSCAPQRLPTQGFRNPAAPSVVSPGLVLLDEIKFLRGVEAPSEDCLFLNVWTRDLDAARNRPVMVWLHGGGFNAGAGSSPVCDGSSLVRQGDVVVVSLNHRLGALGFAHLERVLGPEFAGSANVGMLDIVLALEWVRDNIAGFGGDPGRVTVFGQSGGGWKVSTLLGMPGAEGLFQRAAIQSGPGVRMLVADDAGELADRFLRQLKAETDGAGDPRRVTVEQVIRAQSAIEFALGRHLVPNLMRGFVPVVDGNSLPAHPFDPVPSPGSRSVSVMVGHTRTEMTTFYDRATLTLDDSGLTERAVMLGPRAVEALSAYRERHPGASPARLFAYVHSDVVMLPFAPRIAERHAALGGSPAFYYRFDFETPVLDGTLISPHGLDVPLVFGNGAAAEPFTGGGARPRAMSDVMSSAWLAFAETGNPSLAGLGLPDWPPYRADRPVAMVFDETCRIENDPQAEERVSAEAIVEDLR